MEVYGSYNISITHDILQRRTADVPFSKNYPSIQASAFRSMCSYESILPSDSSSRPRLGSREPSPVLSSPFLPPGL